MAYSYTLKYSANGGSGAPSTQSATSDKSSHTFTISSSEPTRTGYRFLGWSTSSSASSASFSPGGTITLNYAETNSVTLYAVWKKRTYTVSYNGNGGSGAPSSQTKTYGVDLTLSSTVPIRAGLVLLGAVRVRRRGLLSGDTYTDNASITLYAA